MSIGKINIRLSASKNRSNNTADFTWFVLSRCFSASVCTLILTGPVNKKLKQGTSENMPEFWKHRFENLTLLLSSKCLTLLIFELTAVDWLIFTAQKNALGQNTPRNTDVIIGKAVNFFHIKHRVKRKATYVFADDRHRMGSNWPQS